MSRNSVFFCPGCIFSRALKFEWVGQVYTFPVENEPLQDILWWNHKIGKFRSFLTTKLFEHEYLLSISWNKKWGTHFLFEWQFFKNKKSEIIMWIVSTKALSWRSDFQTSVRGITWKLKSRSVILFLTTKMFDNELLRSILWKQHFADGILRKTQNRSKMNLY